MALAPASVLAINGGSSSIKFAVYRAGTVPTLSLSGTLDRIGRSGTRLSWRAKEGAFVEGHTQVPDVTPSPRLLISAEGSRVIVRVIQEAARLRILLGRPTEPVEEQRLAASVNRDLRDAGAEPPPVHVEIVDAVTRTRLGKAPFVKALRLAPETPPGRFHE